MPQDGKKLIFERIQSTENYFGGLCSEISNFTKKKARLRDKYDDLSNALNNSGETGRYNETLSNALSNYAKAFTLLADIKDLEVQRLQSKVIKDLAGYENFCKNARDALKHSLMIQGKEFARRNQMKSKTQRQNGPPPPSNDDQDDKSIVQDFEEKLLNFERQKISDIRQILMDFTLIQMKECAKTMEIFTAVYNDIAAIDVEKDVDEFGQKCLNKNNLKPNNRSQSLSALNSNANSNSALKRSNLSNSSFALSSPNKEIDDNEEIGSKESETNSSNDSKDEQSSESDDESTTETSQQTGKQTSDGDDSDVEIRTVKTLRNKRNSIQEFSQDKRNAPVPQVRFTKMNRT